MSGIGLGLGQRMTTGQYQTIAPRMIQSMEILQMPLADLLEKLQTELQENPFLETRERTADEPDETVTTVGEPVAEFNPDGVLKHDDTGDAEFARMEEMNKDWDDHFDADHRPSRGALEELSDRKLDAMQNMAEAPHSLHDHLLEQIGCLDLEPDLFDLAAFVVSHLDENGYLLAHDPDRPKAVSPIPLEDLARAYTAREVAPDEVEEALRVIQKLDPAGVGARDTKECLLLQVADDTPHAELVRTLIRDHIEDVAFNRLPLIHKKTGADLETVGEAIDQLRRLDPKPGGKFAPDNTRYVVPDVVVERTDDDEYAVRLTDDWLPSVRISKRYVAVTKDRAQPKTVRDQLKQKLQSANWLLSAIEQRRSTLIKVTKAIIAHQRAFLDQGPDHIQPLKMEQIAEQVGVHVTTVSRAVDDKWVQTPRGVFPLRRFFGGGTKSADGVDVAWESIKQKLLEIIAGEDKKSPLSDEDIVKLFTEAGLTVARRTVTKYREALKIPSSRQRRDWTAA